MPELAGRAGLEHALLAPATDPFMLAGTLVSAFLLGAAHALTPGHGKTIVAAYLVGSRGRVMDAVWLGLVVTLTHTASVFVLGLAALYASQNVSLDRIYPALALLSGLLVTGIGVWLLSTRWRAASHARHPHTHPHTGGGSGHRHGGVAARAGLFSLGVSGGLVPCPEALVVLMIAVSLRRLSLGLALLVLFSLGLAAVLIAIGVAMVLAGPALRRLAGENRYTRAMPVASAFVVTLLGILLVAEAARNYRW